jgi:ribokinase
MTDQPLVIGLGQAALDFLGVVPSYPAPDTKCELAGLTIQGGGPVATALVTLSRLGIRTTLLGRVGDDDFGLAIRNGLAEEGVDVSRLETAVGGRSQVAFIAVDPGTGQRTIFWHPGQGTDPDLTLIDPSFITQADLLHLDGLKLKTSLAAARIARQAKLPVVFDAGTLRDGCLELVALTDYLICSEKFFRAFHPHKDVRTGLSRLLALGPRQAVVTMGSGGSYGFDGLTWHHQPALQVKVMDTTGAGDVYHGAYIFGILKGWDLPACMAFASTAAALKCREVGGRTGIPTLAQIRELMGHVFPDQNGQPAKTDHP